METKKLGSLYLIEWVDSYSINEGWELIKDIEEPELVVCHSVGYVLKENNKNIMIVPHISDTDNIESLGAYRGALVIPKVSILNKKELTVTSVVMPKGKAGITDLVGLCPSCREEISRNGVFNNHNCKKP
tara:strand:- start:2948 stop:3337 length:390 start_codon:yes stop_codon:yes gene_type:complete